MRNDFRSFRVDRVERIVPTGACFKPERGKTLADFYRQMEQRDGASLRQYIV